jgi:ubiquinone/menaquinone biosynthesis C-methylase UbiE
VLEIGSGSGFLRDICPNLIASEIFFCPGVSVVLDGQYLPFIDSSIGSIVMTDVLHHIPQPRYFFHEAVRCLKPSGKVIMIEPYVTFWSSLVYTFLHHEPFIMKAEKWEFSSVGPLSGANSALPWIIFKRDLKQFEKEFPELRLKSITPMMPFRY